MTKPSEADEPLLTIEHAAKLMTASAKTIRRRIQNGDLAVRDAFRERHDANCGQAEAAASAESGELMPWA